jgi:hypothetical protein
MSTTTPEITAELFSGEQIVTAISELSDYERYADIATLSAGDEYQPEVLEAFAKLARVLKLPVSTRYGNMVIRREHPIEKLRESALYNLQRKAERGDIEPAYLYGRPGDDA